MLKITVDKGGPVIFFRNGLWYIRLGFDNELLLIIFFLTCVNLGLGFDRLIVVESFFRLECDT